MKTRLIFNPHSGGHRRHPWFLGAVQAYAATRGPAAALVLTERPGHATQLARAALADGCTRVVAIGGDGTMNEVAQALVNAPAALAIVPLGSGNGLALHLGLPAEPRRALALLDDPAATVATIDTGAANGHPFFNAMGCGFDAEISVRVNRRAHRGLGAYAAASLAAFFRHRSQRIVVADNAGNRMELDAYFVSVGNSDQYGNRARFAPGARVDDGLLDLVAVGPPGLLGAVPLAARLFLGTFDRSPLVRRLRGTRFAIERPAPGVIHTDGETHATAATVDVTVRPRSLRLLVPAGPAAGPNPNAPPP